MPDWLNRYKPAGTARTHLLLAAMMWSVVGTLLLYFGVRWILIGRTAYAPLVLFAALTLGLLKGRFVLEHSANRMIDRIRTRGDGRCVGGFLSLRTWGLVLAMIVGGRLLRTGLLPLRLTGVIYAAIGVALVMSSRKLWHAWVLQSAQGLAS